MAVLPFSPRNVPQLAAPDNVSGEEAAPRSFPARTRAVLGYFLKSHPVLVLLGLAFLAAHIAVVWGRPPLADGWCYFLFAASSALAAYVIVRYASRSHGFVAFRWALFASYAIALIVVYFVSFANNFIAFNAALTRNALTAGGITLALVALTLPSRADLHAERFIDIAVALAFCALRFAVMFAPQNIFSSDEVKVLYFTFTSIIGFLIALMACSASTEAERPLFRTAALYFGMLSIGAICCNQISGTLLHQWDAGKWTVTETLCLVVFSLAATYNLDHAPRPRRISSSSLLIQSVLPFTMSLLIIGISILLMPQRRWLGIVGIVAGISAQLARTVVIHQRLRRESELLRLSNTRLDELAHFDSLTGLRNRRSFQVAISKALHLLPIQKENPETQVAALILFDVDGFKGANDSFGHLHGDNCLVEIASLLKSVVAAADEHTFRLGGDEFAAILTARDVHGTLELASDLCERVAALQLHGMDRHLTISAGVALLSTGLDSHGLLHSADLAMYRAKMQGGDCVALFTDDLPEPVIIPSRRLRPTSAI